MDNTLINIKMMNVGTEKKEKKMPGRPRKIPAKQPDPRSGIVFKPTVEDALFEMYYCNPAIFKKALGFYLSLSDMPLDCTFTPDSISFLALDRHKKSKIQISIDINKLNHYYCKSGTVAKFGLSNQYLILHVKTINNDLSNLKWYSIEGKTDETYIDYSAPKYKETHHETLICCGRYHQVDNAGFDDMDYQIRWQWDARWFRKKLAKCKIYGDQLTIKQIGAECPLMFVYSNANGHAKSEEICEGKDEMGFVSNIKSGEIFSISVQVKYWYPVANSAILDSVVQISLHKEKPIMTKILLDDGAICIKVLTAINDIRQDVDISTGISSTRTNRTPSSTRANDPLNELKFSPFDYDSKNNSTANSTNCSTANSRSNSPLNSKANSPLNSPRATPQISPRTTPMVSPRVISPRVAPTVSPRLAPRVSPRVVPRVANLVQAPPLPRITPKAKVNNQELSGYDLPE